MVGRPDVFSSLVGKRRAGSDLTRALVTCTGRNGAALSWMTIDRWRKRGLVERTEDGRWLLTESGEQYARQGRRSRVGVRRPVSTKRSPP